MYTSMQEISLFIASYKFTAVLSFKHIENTESYNADSVFFSHIGFSRTTNGFLLVANT